MHLALNPVTGTLPSGRYGVALDAVHRAFVADPMFAASKTRQDVWDGFLAYDAAWQVAESEMGDKVVLAWWIGGSFISDAMDPQDIDVSPVLDIDFLTSMNGKPGSGKAKALIKHRASVRATFGVEPFPLEWSAVSCTLFPERLSATAQRMLMMRGGLDEWWGRLRPPGPKGPPEPPAGFAERGYVEVLR